MIKEFKTFQDQIELLKQRGLRINNEKKLMWYLKSYNYQNLINGYNDFFMDNNDSHHNHYKELASSDGIIELFNFDRTISKLLLSSLQNIERMISTALSYTISEIMYENGDCSGQIFAIDKESNLAKKIFIINQKINGYEIVKKRFCETDQQIKNSYNNKNFTTIPIWTLIISSSFGNLIAFLENLKENIFFKVMKNSNLKNIEALSKKELIHLFKIFKDIRNRICHNNVLFNITISNTAKNKVIKKVINDKTMRKHKTKLYEIVHCIEFVDKNSNNYGYVSQEITKKIDNFKDIEENIVEEIKMAIWIKKS